MIDLAGKRVVVVGLGSSGIAACKLLLKRGAKVVGNDARGRGAVSAEVLALEALGATLALGGHDAAGMSESDLVIVSPGVPPLAAVDAAAKAGVPVWGEVELAVQALRYPAPVVAVGGTNGKSTTTELVGAIFRAAGKSTFVGGNLGEPLALHTEERFDVVVLEVSSFQMERVETFKPKVSVLLNVTPDHLDRYPDFDAYARAKGNAFERQGPDDVAVVPVGDALCLREAKRGAGRVVTFGPGGDVDVTDDTIQTAGLTVQRNAVRLAGEHNATNMAAAIAVGLAMNVPGEVITRALQTFEGLPHRMALVAEHRGIRFYDDSKGTNVGASVTALRGAKEPKVVLIAGGRDKGGSYEPLVEALREKGRAAVLIGEAAPLLAAAIGDVVPVRTATTMDEAVRMSAELAEAGDAVLLSPACSSFDMFRDYKHRGDAFVSAVYAIVTGASS